MADEKKEVAAPAAKGKENPARLEAIAAAEKKLGAKPGTKSLEELGLA